MTNPIGFSTLMSSWCDGCKNHIGMGVRYNAEKTKVGMYYSTSVYQFRMKCHLCDNYIEIKTDPGNLDYVIVSGARRQENRWDPTENGQVVPDMKEVQRKLFDDPMYKLEHVAADLAKGSDSKPRLRNLYKRSLDVWEDDYAANFKLRAAFRKRKHDEKLLERPKLNLKLLPATQQDEDMAAMLSLRAKRSTVENEKRRIDKLVNESVLPVTATTTFSESRREKVLNQGAHLKKLVVVKRRQENSTVVSGEAGVANPNEELEKNGESTTHTDFEGISDKYQPSAAVETSSSSSSVKPPTKSLVLDYSSSSGAESDNN